VTVQLAFELDPADALDMAAAEALLAAAAAQALPAKPCRCTRPLPWDDESCAMCGRLIHDNHDPAIVRKGEREGRS
jgi:hypothetical protein